MVNPLLHQFSLELMGHSSVKGQDSKTHCGHSPHRDTFAMACLSEWPGEVFIYFIFKPGEDPKSSQWQGKCFETEEAPSQLPRGTSLDALPQSLEVAVQVCMNTGLFAKSSLLEHSGL